MFNNNFKNNWKKILNYNSKINLVESPEEIREQVRIPLTPIHIEGYLLYYLFELIYPKFINDQQNILDIILSDYDIENKVLGIYLYKTKKAGIHESIEKLPKDLVIIKEKDITNMNQLFNMIQSQITEKKRVKINSIRIFTRRGIDLIKTYCDNLEGYSINEFIYRFVDLIQKLINENLIYILPEPNIYRFLKDFFKILDNLKLSKLFRIIENLISNFAAVFVFYSRRLNIITEISKRNSKLNESKISINLRTTKDLELELKQDLSNNSLLLIQKKLNSKSVVSLNQDLLISFFLDLFDLEIPIKKENFKLILQKFIYGIRSFEIHWNIVPRPRIYNALIRFLVRFLGININFKKLSHWTIPDMFFNLIDTYFGLNSNILLIIVNKNRIFTKTSLLIIIENSSLRKIIPIDNPEIITDNKIDSLDLIRNSILEKFGINPIIVKVDKSLIQMVISVLIFKFYKIKPLSFLKILKMIKKEEYFQIYPRLPPYQLIKKKRTISLLKLFLSIIIDKHEF
ncbi:MAG: hypothetical protein ACFE78_03995 [Candidatus Hodarchaeota archaeon]